jgi:hypothetical protein
MNHYELSLFLLLVLSLIFVLCCAVRVGGQIRKENQRRAFDEEQGNFDEEDQVAAMTQHFIRSTISATFYCGECKKPTSHRPCLECIARLEAQHQITEVAEIDELRRKLRGPEQTELFG